MRYKQMRTRTPARTPLRTNLDDPYWHQPQRAAAGQAWKHRRSICGQWELRPPMASRRPSPTARWRSRSPARCQTRDAATPAISRPCLTISTIDSLGPPAALSNAQIHRSRPVIDQGFFGPFPPDGLLGSSESHIRYGFAATAAWSFGGPAVCLQPRAFMPLFEHVADLSNDGKARAGDAWLASER